MERQAFAVAEITIFVFTAEKDFPRLLSVAFDNSTAVGFYWPHLSAAPRTLQEQKRILALSVTEKVLEFRPSLILLAWRHTIPHPQANLDALISNQFGIIGTNEFAGANERRSTFKLLCRK
jgi:hypothetical protein